MQIEFESAVTRWEKRVDSWFFATMPAELSVELRELPSPPRGFGSLRVQARIGATIWSTSIFFDGTAFVLPLKKAVRAAQGIEEGDVITVDLDIIDL
ncbi:DUF1905 domain-containing protein [Microbacterium hydrocarbonoxydans]|uniref:DUF1905 domain-containing protein n=1 Tax=Microbacterium hydrocarbonoxydans TaxID=273678 RepID=UPI0007BC3A19|nr:DUF1905 domain-containing protein [Microbacterium hydrocarbonoxydans]GAT73535.1 hypothetical protein MHM582_2029 [Microbacterium sp. HM58-2]